MQTVGKHSPLIRKTEIMKPIILILISLILTILGCTNEVEINNREYIIENATNYNIDIRFYDRVSGDLNSQKSTMLKANEELLSNRIEINSNSKNSEEYPSLAFGSDSVKVILNNTKTFTNVFNIIDGTFSDPINRNLFKHSNYESLGNETYVFKITEQDYQNAENYNTDCITGDLNNNITADQILGEWKLTRGRNVWPVYLSTDFSNDNIIYNFKPDGILVISGVGTEEPPHTYSDGEYSYVFEHVDSWDETVWKLTINSQSWNAVWTYISQNDLMVLSQSYIDGSELCFIRN